MASKAERYQLARQSVLPDLGADGAGQASSDYAALLEILPDAIIVHLDDGHIVYANAAGANLFGAARPDDLIGRLSCALVPPETSEAVQKICHAVLQSGETSEFDGLFLARLDDKRIEVSGQCAPFTWNGARALITIYRDLSAQRKVEEDFQMRLQDLEMNKLLLERSGSEYAALAEQLRAARDAAELANRSKSDFLANMSHELRTPLNAIMGFSEVIKDEMLGGVGVPQYQEYANDIHNSGGHLLEIINEILDLSKIEAGRFDLSISEVDLRDVMSAVQKLIDGRVEAKNVSLKIDCSPALPLLLSDKKAVRQMLLNLLSNALKFTPEGGTISISAFLGADGGVQVEVGDNGIGIREEDIERVMQPFGQVDSPLAREHQGTGLGLPLVRAMIDLHGGTLGLQSTVGAGTCVTLHFPAERSVPARKAS